MPFTVLLLLLLLPCHEIPSSFYFLPFCTPVRTVLCVCRIEMEKSCLILIPLGEASVARTSTRVYVPYVCTYAVYAAALEYYYEGIDSHLRVDRSIYVAIRS